jgi:hypothetical protein
MMLITGGGGFIICRAVYHSSITVNVIYKFALGLEVIGTSGVYSTPLNGTPFTCVM